MAKQNRIRARFAPKTLSTLEIQRRLIAVEDELEEINEGCYSRRRFINDAKRYAVNLVTASVLGLQTAVLIHFAIKFW